MKKIILFCLVLLTLPVRAALSPTFQLLPKPQIIETYPGKGMNWQDITYIKVENGATVPVLSEMLDRLPHTNRTGYPVILRLSNQVVPESEEGYTLEVKDNGILITGRSMKGIFYGCQTLEQLMEDSRDFSQQIPAMKITDYPAISYRAVHFDVKHHLDRIEYYYREIDRLAHYKINAIIWEIEDKMRYTRRPEIGASNAISKQEMQAICRYARDRYIEITPLVQGLGHAGFILKHHPELREDSTSDWGFCPTNPKTYELQFDLYRDAIEAMPYSRFLHIGGDEITAIGIDERCKATKKTPFELQMYWLKKVCDFAKANGRIPIFWDDMPLKYGDLWKYVDSNESEAEVNAKWNTQKLDSVINLFPKDCIYMRWMYSDATRPGHQHILKWYHDKGLRVMAATAASSGNSPVLPRENTKAGYIKGFCDLTAQNKLEGILATAWDDGSPHSETVWRGYIALGEYGWNPKGRTIDEFKEAHAQREYGFRPEDKRMKFLDELEQAVFFYDGALVTSGRRNPAPGTTTFTLIQLPDTKNHGNWSKMYKAKIDQAQFEEKRFHSIDEGVSSALDNALRGRYTLQIYQQINYMQHYPTRLLLALYNYDKAATNKERNKAIQQIKEECAWFPVMRQNLENVYSQTRFMYNPKDYVLDMNHHYHLAAKTNNSDWMYYYEIPMVGTIEKWISDNHL